MTESRSITHLIEVLLEKFSDKDIDEANLWRSVNTSIEPGKLITVLAEAVRIPETQLEKIMEEVGFSDLVAKKRLEKSGSVATIGGIFYKISDGGPTNPYADLFKFTFSPGIDSEISVGEEEINYVNSIREDTASNFSTDPFLHLYREDVLGYYDSFVENDAKQIDKYISDNFDSHPKYILNSGIGGNEMFNHTIADFHNLDPNKKSEWIVISAPKQLEELPEDATGENTLFMEFSRSGKTEETVKIHEFTPRSLKRIVFANSGPLKELGLRDGNLVLDFPDQVSGRFGRNKTPILLAPMYVSGLDTKTFWNYIESSINDFDLSNKDNLPMQIASYIYLFQKKNNVNNIFFGVLGNILNRSADEFVQFWNEGVTKDGNDIILSKFLGLPRDSHTVVEGFLANHKTKLGLFLFQNELHSRGLPPFVNSEIDPINKNHEGYKFGEDELVLAEANFLRFAELMPAIKIDVLGDLSLKHLSVLSQLWTDVTYCYSKLMGVDPGSNPEVKFVRDRATDLLTKKTTT